MTFATGYQRGLASVALFTLAAGDFWRYLLSWWGWGATTAIIAALAIIELVRTRADLRRLPASLVLFLALATASTIWSVYPGATAIGAFSTVLTAAGGAFLAICLSWDDLLDAFAIACRWILGASLVFEIVVATVIGRPVLPLWVDYSHLDSIPQAFYWSRDVLLEGGRIQGIVGNANILGMIALLALILFVFRVGRRRGSIIWNTAWAVMAGVVLLLTRSSTVTVTLVAVVAVFAVALLIGRTAGRTRMWVSVGAVLAGVAGVAGAIFGREQLLGLLGRSPDLTNRIEIWDAVLGLAAERPVAGWGWVSYWAPWVEPFDDLVVIRGVTYLQAHNAWIDVYLQLGILGVIIFGALVASTAIRSWIAAVDGFENTRGLRLPTPLGAMPLLLLTALLVQSLAESRLLIELGFALLVVIAIKTGWRGRDRSART